MAETMTDTERLDFMLGYWGQFGGGVTQMGGGLAGSLHEARIRWTGWDAYGRGAEFITVAETSRDAIDLAIVESEKMRREDWGEQWPDWCITDERNPLRRPANISPVEQHRRTTELSEQGPSSEGHP